MYWIYFMILDIIIFLRSLHINGRPYYRVLMLLLRNFIKHRALLPFAASFSKSCHNKITCNLCGRHLEDITCSTADVLDPAPKFQGKAFYKNDFKNISLNDYKGKYVVLFFYPADFSFVCPTEIREFSAKAEKFRNKSNLNITTNRLRSNWVFSRFDIRSQRIHRKAKE